MLRRTKSGKPGMLTGVRTQKKAQPEEVALKVPPKEEVLEERAPARRATAQANYAKNLTEMQALSAAMHHTAHLTK
jgi:hypothetical protein